MFNDQPSQQLDTEMNKPRSSLPVSPSPCLPVSPSPPLHSRRTFLADAGMGFTGLALGALLHEDGYSATPEKTRPDGKPYFPAKANSVIWIFLAGGVSHMESFDIKPALNKFAGKTFEETPFKDFLDKERREKNLMGQGMSIPPHKELMALNTGYRKYGECGLDVGDWFSHIGRVCR